MEKFAIGLLIGGIGGALLTANNYKMRTLVKKSQEELQTRVDQMLDDKIESIEKTSKKIKEEGKEKVDALKEKIEDGANVVLEKAENKIDKLSKRRKRTT